MEFIDYQKVKENEKLVNETLPKISELARTIVEDGLKISAKEIYNIATGKLSLNMVYTNEAKNRVKDSPTYVINENVNLAASRANKHYTIVNEVRKGAGILARLKPDSFQISNDYSFSYSGDLEKDLKALFTRPLNKKQIELVESVKAFKDSLAKFNNSLEEASLYASKIDIKIPLTDQLGEVDIKKILNVDYEEIENKQKKIIEQGIKQKEIRKQQKARLDRLYKNHPNKDEEVLKFLSFDPDGSKYDDDFHRNLIEPTKGTFKRTKNLA